MDNSVFNMTFLITRQEYNCLMNCFSSASANSEIEMYYYDTDDLYLHRKNVTCNIRYANDIFYANIKRHGIPCAGIEEQPLQITHAPEIFPFSDFPISCRGIMRIKQNIHSPDTDVRIILEKNKYLNQTDYDVTIEYGPKKRPQCKAIVVAIANHLAKQEICTIEDFIKRAEKEDSKPRRFFERYITLFGDGIKTNE